MALCRIAVSRQSLYRLAVVSKLALSSTAQFNQPRTPRTRRYHACSSRIGGIGSSIQRRTVTTIAEESLKKTPLYELHVRHGAKMVPFGGYSMPVQYEDLGVGESHAWTREKASIFDVSHM